MTAPAGRSSASDRTSDWMPRRSLSEIEQIVTCLADEANETFDLDVLANAVSDEKRDDGNLGGIFRDMHLYGLLCLGTSDGQQKRLSDLGARLATKPSPAVRQQAFLEVEAFSEAFDDFVTGKNADEPSWLTFFRDRFHGQTSEDGSAVLASAQPMLSSDRMSQVDLAWGDEDVQVRLTVRARQPFPDEAFDHIATAAKINKEIADWLVLVKDGSGTTGARWKHDADTT